MRPLLRILTIILVPILVSVAVFQFMATIFLQAKDPSVTAPVLVEIEQGRSFRGTSKQLEKLGLVRFWWSLEVLARMKKGGTVVNAGEYEIAPSMTPGEILQKLVSGDVFKRKVTIPEGTSIWEMGKIIEAAGLLPKADFDAAVVDPVLLNKAGIVAKSFEGYLFPETYNFSRPIKSEGIIWKMLEEGEQHWKPEYSDQADNLRMSRHEVITLASIIEKESGVTDEHPIISSVLHNRLRQGMKLQVDPTVIYGVPNFNGNLTKQDLETPTPYNTYVNFGLPPGPIANPGASAINAALFPAETTYLYFVADRKGRHVFSTTLDEHNDAVRQFQLQK